MAQPIRDVLRSQGRSQAWLARTTGYSYQHVKNVINEQFNGSARFRARCAEVLGMDETALFRHGSPDAAASRERAAA